MWHTETCSQRDALCSSGSVIWRVDLIIVLIFIHLTPTTTNEQSIYTVSNYCTCSNRTWEGKGRPHDCLIPAWMFAWRQQSLPCASAHYDRRVCSSNYCVYGRKTYQFGFRKKWFKYTRLKHSLICHLYWSHVTSPFFLRSLYRDILFLSLVALGKDNIDIGEY